MGILRILVKWVSDHRIWASIISMALIAILAIAYLQFEGSRGSVSEPLVKGEIVQSVYGIGTVMANKIYQIIPGITTTLRSQFVKEGDIVKKGDDLMRIDEMSYTAPFAGVITALPYKIGDNIFASVPVLTLVDLLDRYVVVSLEQQGALHVVIGQKAKLSFDTMRGSSYEGTVKSIYSNATYFLARIEIANFPPNIIPGMTADVAITIRTVENALLVPVAAIENGNTVWLNTTFPEKVEIKTGIVDKAFAEVISGDLKVGERVLIRKQAAP